MTELTDLSDTDALNTAVTGNSTEGNVANMGNMDNLQQAILGMLSRFRNANIFRLRDNTDNTKLLAFDLSALPTGTTTLVVPAGGTLGLTTPWVAYTPTLSAFGTATSVVVLSRRVGGSLEVVGRFTAGTSTASVGSLQLGFDGVNGGVTVSSALNSARVVVGSAAFSYVGVAPAHVLAVGGGTVVNFGIQNASNAGMTPANGSTLLASGDSVTFSFSVPVEGWS